MNIDYSYYKKRGQFGRPYYFVNEGPIIVENYGPQKARAEKYVTKSFVNKGTQKVSIMSCNEANTWRADFSDRGINHDQGGWPKDLNIFDEEAVLRFRKKLERENTYIESMRHLSKPIEHAILQNNAINIYQKYFEGKIKEYTVNESLSRIRSIFHDPNEIGRPVSHLSWSPEKCCYAASYCNTNFQRMSPYESKEAYVWDVEIPSMVQTVFNSRIPILNLEWNPMDKNFLIGGLYTGQIAFYDIRKAPEHVEISPLTVSHRDPVHSVLWIYSKTGADFFSTSYDGVVKWWDCRNLSQVLDYIIVDITRNESMTNAFAASTLEYDPSIPAKYLVGTDNGYVVCGNRKGTTIAEKLSWAMKCHSGPVNSVQRNPGFGKFYLTVGDWNARIWSEDCKESAIMWTKPYKVCLTRGEWSNSRYSVFFLTRSDGYLDLWDLLLDQMAPIVSLKISDRPLTAVRGEDEGQLAVVGDDSGKICLIQYSDSLSTCAKNDKAVLSAMFDRESHRERILELRMREVRLALKLKAMTDDVSLVTTHDKGPHDKGPHEKGSVSKKSHDRRTQDKGTHEVAGVKPSRDKGVHERATIDKGSRDKGAHERRFTGKDSHHKGTHDKETHDRELQHKESYDRDLQDKGIHIQNEHILKADDFYWNEVRNAMEAYEKEVMRKKLMQEKVTQGKIVDMRPLEVIKEKELEEPQAPSQIDMKERGSQFQ